MLVSFSAEKDRYHEFEDLCDAERKSISLKLGEMIDEELQKNALGVAREPNPLNIHTYVSDSNKPLQLTLEMWLAQVHGAKDNESLLAVYEGQASKVMVTARNLRQQAFRRRILKR